MALPSKKEIVLDLRRPHSFDVARPRQSEVTPGDKILIRANDKRLGLTNGQVLTISSIAADGALQTKDGQPSADGMRIAHPTSIKNHGWSYSLSRFGHELGIFHQTGYDFGIFDQKTNTLVNDCQIETSQGHYGEKKFARTIESFYRSPCGFYEVLWPLLNNGPLLAGCFPLAFTHGRVKPLQAIAHKRQPSR